MDQPDRQDIPIAAEGNGNGSDPNSAEIALGREEASSLTRGLSAKELREEEAAANDHGRRERFRDSFEEIARDFLKIIGLCIMVTVLVWFWHIVTPTKWHFLEETQISQIRGLIFGGFTGFVASHLKKRLG